MQCCLNVGGELACSSDGNSWREFEIILQHLFITIAHGQLSRPCPHEVVVGAKQDEHNQIDEVSLLQAATHTQVESNKA